jgi:sulfatase modifying factor 1
VFACGVAGVSGAGCDEALSDSAVDDFATLVTVRGTVASGAGSVDLNRARVALLWKVGPEYVVGGDAPIIQSTRSQAHEFVIRLKERPPTSARAPVAQADVAVAGLVAYRDANGNGRLDRQEAGATCSLDPFLGVGQHHALFYLYDGRGVAPFPPLPAKVQSFAVRAFTERCFDTLTCAEGHWIEPEQGAFGRLEYSGVTVELDSRLKPGACETGEPLDRYAVCSRIRADLDRGFQTECPPARKTCEGNSDGVHPQVVYDVTHEQLVGEALAEGCCPLPLGDTPWYCNPALGCPPGYHCVGTHCTVQDGPAGDERWSHIPAGEFDMGTGPTDPCRFVGLGEQDLRRVRLTSAFLMSRSEATQSRFSPTGASASDDCPDCPVESVTWHEAAAYCQQLSITSGAEVCYDCKWADGDVLCWEATGFEGKEIYKCTGYRLPTEAEWERAYRAGTATPLYNGPITSCMTQDSHADQIAWYSPKDGPEIDRPQPVMLKLPNGWGLYDMSGNVAEWVQDWSPDAGFEHETEPVTVDPVYATKDSANSGRVTRGGSHLDLPFQLRASARGAANPTGRGWWIGFRCIRRL